MTREATASEEKSSRSYWGFVLWPLLILVLYPLSAGPVVRAVSNKIIPYKFLKVYIPVLSVIDRTPLRRPFGRYIRLWAPYMTLTPDGELLIS